MAKVFPVKISRPLRNKVCIFPEREACNLTSSDINAFIRRNPYSYYNIFFKPYIRRLEGDKKFNAIKRQYNKFKKKNIIEKDENEGFYIYNIIDIGGNEFTGIIGKIPFTEIENKIIKQLEYSPKNIVQHKFNLFNTSGFISKPLNVVYKNNNDIDALIKRYKSHIPLFEFTKSDGYIYEVWQVLNKDDIQIITKSFAKEKSFLLIDNKSEFEGLFKVYNERSKNKHISGQEDFNFFPAFLISRNQVKIHEYKKGIPYESTIELDKLLSELEKHFKIEIINNDAIPDNGEIFLYSLLQKYKLKLKKSYDKNMPGSVIFDKYILDILEKLDPASIPDAMKFCSGDRSLKCVENHLNKKNCKYGFIIKPSTFEQIDYAVSKQKKISVHSIYLEPRLLKGLFIYEF